VLLALSAGVVINIEVAVCADVLSPAVVVLQCVPETRRLQKFRLKGELSLAIEGEDLAQTSHVLTWLWKLHPCLDAVHNFSQTVVQKLEHRYPQLLVVLACVTSTELIQGRLSELGVVVPVELTLQSQTNA